MNNTFEKEETNKELNSFYETINIKSQDTSMLYHSYEKIKQFNKIFMEEQKKSLLKNMYL